MKTLKWMGAVVAATLCLTSCLGDGNNTASGSSFAVAGVAERSYVPVFNTATYGPLYSPAYASQLVTGDCYAVSYEIDFNSAENANASSNGYYTANVTILDEIPHGIFSYAQSDTSALLPGEFALTNAGVSVYSGAYVDGNLFVGIAYDGDDKQVNRYTLYWDTQEEPTKEDNVSTYHLSLRVAKERDGAGTTAALTEYSAFNIGNDIENIARREGREGAKSFNLKINYLSSINEKDSTDLTWKSFTVPFAAISESEN